MNYVCQHCNQSKATVHITDTMPEKRERHLCEVCAEKEGVIIKQQHQTTNAILQEFIKHKSGLAGVDDRTCPRCGMTFREFRLKGQLGCPDDYEAFRSLLQPLIERAHEGGTQHIGKVPSTADETIRKQTGLLRLRRELDEAVDQENYELAARLRDQIRELGPTESA
ncbi:MAG: UvrB/UvrC motif-containing protein [Phycisphaerales bacterium]|nr:MAG: UvrB/UvrC motif-containing protein [Phycisphaerales bacterium]